LQGASEEPFLLVLPRNPSPWHCEQDSFATAIVSERFHSKFTNISSRCYSKFAPNVPLINFYHFTIAAHYSFIHEVFQLKEVLQNAGVPVLT
jgi:hypothetical protein